LKTEENGTSSLILILNQTEEEKETLRNGSMGTNFSFPFVNIQSLFSTQGEKCASLHSISLF